MNKTASFQVDPRLAALLGETYRSSEEAIKELVDNAWDADADHAWICLPRPMTAEPIVVKDDGSGMTERQVRSDYLRVARDRRLKSGERTESKSRLVKGRKGIGKFAGLTVADLMQIETRSRAHITTLTIPREELMSAVTDLERFAMPIQIADCDPEEHGTTISLSRLHQNLVFPDPDRLKQLLVLEYGREDGFAVFVDGTALDLTDVRGEGFSGETTIPDVGKVRLRFKITDNKLRARSSGIVIRVGGKVVGKPTYFGLDSAGDVPRGILQRLYGEVEADGLADDVTADWGAVIENSRGLIEIEAGVRGVLKHQLEKTCQREMSLAKGRLQQEINRRVEKLPEHRRESAKAAFERLMLKFYEESEERIGPIVSVMLDALERDEYWTVIQEINGARHGDVELLAEALATFGLLEIAIVGQQAHRRLKLLDSLDELIGNAATLEKTMHTALENNLWVFGAEFSLVSFNRTLASILARYTDEKFSGFQGTKRPDLLLVNRFDGKYNLIEFKRPDHSLTRDDVSQAEKYRDALLDQLPSIELLVVGKDYDHRITQNIAPAVTLASYGHLLGAARSRLTWLIQELKSEA